jgi:hypothetical protein
VDDEMDGAERASVAAHLQRCARCRAEVEAEATARQTLRAHAAVARTLNESPSWRPRVFRLGQPSLALAGTVAAMAAIIVVGGAVLLRPAPVVAVGIIGDSFCGERHRYTSAQRDGRDCTLGCVKRGAAYVLVTDDLQVYRIEDQPLDRLAGFANARVAVTGRVTGSALVAHDIATVH